ncbi:MAG: hypothetical protein HQK50_08060 [Oligoflexia bacterium]|nr:hypothetical protein [Oligoflexia bacterium]
MRSRFVNNGPLGFYANEFYFELLFFRYKKFYCWNLLLVFKDLNRWLHKNNIPLAAFDEAEVNRFLAMRRRKWSEFHTAGSISAILNFFWNRGLIPIWIRKKVIQTPFDSLIKRYEKYLTEERNISKGNIWLRKKIARDFLSKSCGQKACLKKIKVKMVRSYILQKKTQVTTML